MVRTLAIDWSGALDGASRKIWLAEISNGQLVRLECGRDRNAIVTHLVEESARDPNLIVGLDFAFSLPSWFLTQNSLSDAPALWALVARDGEQWLKDCEAPFWGRPGKGCPDVPEHFRRTDLDVPSVGGIRPKSVFQIGGAGAVGTGSIRGMPALLRLRNAGFAIWPFDPPGRPLVVEIYPRALTGGVNKGSLDARREYLNARYPELPEQMRADAVGSDDAFDALVSALVMHEHAHELESLPATDDPQLQLEGAIWIPGSTLGELRTLPDDSPRENVQFAREPARGYSKDEEFIGNPAARMRAAPPPAGHSEQRSRPHQNSYWIPGRPILAGEYPGHAHRALARKKLATLLYAGITVFLDLTHEHELVPYEDLLREAAAHRGIRSYYFRLPIDDMGVPAPMEMRRILDVIALAEKAGETIYVHCWGGVGRTGTVVGCLLAENGCSGEEALSQVGSLFQTTSEEKRANHPAGSPQVDIQRLFVRSWSREF